jgi:sortase A
MMEPEPKHKHRSRWIAPAARFLLVSVGLLALLYCGWAGWQMHASQRIAATIDAPLRPASQDAQQQLVPGNDPPSSRAGVIGRIEIPEIALSVPMMASISKDGLLRGAGHVPGTALPGGLGTIGIAGHRDTFFRPLRGIRPGMQIKVIGAAGAYRYQVDSTEIVDPEEVKVLDIASRPALTLITCYPFNYIGAAPRRFIVHAHLLSVAPDGG